MQKAAKPVKIVITTGGGDAPGINAVIKGAVSGGIAQGFAMYGSRRGFGGLLGDARIVHLKAKTVRGITHQGGTILGTTNRGNPFKWPLLGIDGNWREEDRSEELVAAFKEREFDCLIAIGGDGTLAIAQKLFEMGVPVIGVPKTIDNDVGSTDVTFGFDTAVSIATEALDRVHTTAESHERVLVVEVMGRNAGWIALHSGLAGGADVILIPEIPYDIDAVCKKIRARQAHGIPFSIVVVAEGALPLEGGATVKHSGVPGGAERLGGISEAIATAIHSGTGKETRTLTLGHLLRGGSPTTFDRLLGVRFGAAAVRAAHRGEFGNMVAFSGQEIKTLPIKEGIGRLKTVPLDGDTIQTARDLGVCLGDA